MGGGGGNGMDRDRVDAYPLPCTEAARRSTIFGEGACPSRTCINILPCAILTGRREKMQILTCRNHMSTALSHSHGDHTRTSNQRPYRSMSSGMPKASHHRVFGATIEFVLQSSAPIHLCLIPCRISEPGFIGRGKSNTPQTLPSTAASSLITAPRPMSSLYGS